MKHYETLSVAKDATDDEIKKAYKKLASIHHPDKGGDTAKFQEIQAAYSALDTPQKRAQYENGGSSSSDEFKQYTNMNDILNEMRRAHGRFKQTFELAVRVPVQEAFKGFTMKLNLNGEADSVKVPAGIPNGARGKYKTEGNRDVYLTVQFEESEFTFVSINEAAMNINGNSFTGTLDTGRVLCTVKVDVLDVLLGAWVTVKDILGESLKVRVPSGHRPDQLLKVKGKGYKNWDTHKAEAGHRGDLLVKIEPQFSSVLGLDKKKVQELNDIVNPSASKKE